MASSPGTAPESEGTTLGRNSIDTSQPNTRTNRNRISGGGGGFLLDSVYATNSRQGSSTQRSHATDSEKRRHVDDDIIVPKKRAISDRGNPQSRRSLRQSPLAAVTNVSASEVHDSSHNESAASRHASSRSSYASNVGLDTDPVQIVNLALNLSELRRRATNAGRVPSSPLPGIPRNPSNNQGLFPTADNASRGLRHSSLYADSRFSRNTGPLTPSIPQGLNNHGVAAMLPISDLQDMDIACSQATLVRIEKAKQHFELFSKYLELLSYLPPLQHSPYGIQSTGRAYNPLQSIRNRKIRIREKNFSATDAEGWQDVSKVEEWLASVEAAHKQNNNDPYQCITLPPFHGEHEGGLVEQEKSWQATSPPSSVRVMNRSGTTKMQRPRLEWAISPAELFADAVWVESGSNKSKIYDREGDKLYPDSSKLKFAGSRSFVEAPEPAQQREIIPTEQAVTLPSFITTKREARARHERHLSKLSNGQTTPRDHMAEGGYAPRWTRSSSLSDESSSDDVFSRGRTRLLSRKAKMKAEAAMQAEKLHRVLHGHSDSSNAGLKRSKPTSHPSSVKAGDVDKTQMLISPAGSSIGKEERRMSLDEMDSTAPNSPAHGPIFPSITTNLSPPSSRSPSPQKRLPRIMETLHEKANSRRHFHAEGEGFDESPSGDSQLRKRPTIDSSPRDNLSPRALEPSPMPETPLSHDDMLLDDFRRSDTHGSFKPYGSHESRLKGFLKNSRIAEIVGSEVSKVGDMIRRKDGSGHSRQSSYASSIISDPHDSDEERSEGESTPSKRTSLRRGSTFSDEESGLPWRKSNGRTKTFLSNLPSIGPSFRNNNQDESYYQQSESSRVSDIHFVTAHPDLAVSSVDTTPYSERRNSYGFIPPSSSRDLNSKLHRHDEITNAALPGVGRLVRPPVTGLANAEVSTTTTTNHHHRPTLTTGSHGWSLSDRSIPTLNDTTLLQKREVLRCQALLLTSGVKASEIFQRYEKSRDPSITPPPQFLIESLVDPKAPIPHTLPRIDEFNYAARNLLERLETTKTGLNKSMYLFSKSTLLPLEKEIDTLEDFINNHLTPRVRAAALEAESLSTQLNTTSTLEIKQLSETLDKGLRKRNRRLRSIRRIGFSLLEWTLVGVMWWLWLIVMVFKVIRGVGKGVVKGVRWILWL
ncbi:hypothetical protein EYB25_005616 [Talaromyces marneffei]|uniref:Maintenance of telomere capping protein 4 n=1 Tax=Talaromyces marneffei PM1 TaxID=1077442 RepID=A0A093XLF0_TALMA|nr:uncharacterized protein EYB26_007090 [Talaromyces marneffei]KAE8551726.1 hypothetical protein EYB25_005616 [Talaromyces marneffei]QGA19401.1 hypothetical protein EYB26_007090 [Talaromyces marneffei]